MNKEEQEIEKDQQRRRKRRRRQRRSTSFRWKRLFGIILALLIICGVTIAGVNHVVSLFTDKNEAAPTTETQTSMSTTPLKQQALDKPMYILVVGRDNEHPTQGDALFLVSVNKEQNNVDVIGIPSNSKIESRDKKTAETINTIYSTGGIDLTKAVVEDIFHITIPYYMIVDEDSFKQSLQVLGTPDFFVETDMYHTDATSGIQDIQIAKGYQALSADSAYGYMRYADDGKDMLGRMQRQERFMKALLNSYDASYTITKLWHIWRIWDHYESNISTFDMMRLAFSLRALPQDNIHYYILAGTKEVLPSAQEVWTINPTDAQRLIGITMGTVSPDENTDEMEVVHSSKNKKVDDVDTDLTKEQGI